VRLPALAGRHGAPFIDASVPGTRQPAELGKLLVLAAAPGPLRDQVRPLFEAVAARTVWVSDRPGDGTRLELVANAWVVTIVADAAQAIAFADGLRVDPRVVLNQTGTEAGIGKSRLAEETAALAAGAGCV
jgi:3-hydroxyisobutyrate dehydrogenase